MSTTLGEVDAGIVYHLREFHPVIDAIGYFEDEELLKWLVMIQVSLSPYKNHKSKAASLFEKTIGAEKKIDDSCTLLEYYKGRVNAADMKCMYVYISPLYHRKIS